MKKSLIAAAVATVCAASAFAQEAAPAPEHTFTANVGIVSDYLFRGISQTDGNPAIQGGVDYSHSSGIYVGTWLSSISWISDQIQSVGGQAHYPTEMDVYAGFRSTFADDFGYDVGVITYNYPGSGRNAAPGGYVSPFTAEIYGALSWKFLSVKYSQVVSDNFVAWGFTDGTAKSKNSNYIEANLAYDLGDGWGLSGHIGHQKVKDFDGVNSPGKVDAGYTDWNVGVTKDIGFGVVGLKYSETDAKSCNEAGGAYCWSGYDVSKGRALATFTKTF